MPEFFSLSHGIVCVDTLYERPRLACCYVMVENGQAAIIDTGTSLSVRQVLAAVQDAGLTPDQVAYIIPTHAHLDHAGGAGALMAACPQAQMVVHPQAARHLIDPSRLIASSTGVYGEAGMREKFGVIEPVSEERVIQTHDEMTLSLNGRPLHFLHTEGHARHHFCVFDEASRGVFTGDSFGMCYPEFTSDRGPFVVPPTTPTQFDPRAWHATIDRILGLQPLQAYLTHFGPVSAVASVGRQLRAGIDAFSELAESVRDAEERHDRLRDLIGEWLLDQAAAHGAALSREEAAQLLAMDIELNAQGVAFWLDRAQR